MKKIIQTDNAPQAVGPYSQAVIAGNTMYISGQIPLDPSTGEIIDGSITDKFNKIMEAVKAILQEGGMSLQNVAKVSVFLLDMNDFGEMNKAYMKYFTDNYPAREAIQVAALPKGSDIEISCIAVTD